jgi:hypothetical protein
VSENLQLNLAENNPSNEPSVDIKVVRAADTHVFGSVLADMAENELEDLPPDLLSSSKNIEMVDTDVEAGFHPIDYNDDSAFLTHDSVAQNQLSPHFEDYGFHKDDQRVGDDIDEAAVAAAEPEQCRGKHILDPSVSNGTTRVLLGLSAELTTVPSLKQPGEVPSATPIKNEDSDLDADRSLARDALADPGCPNGNFSRTNISLLRLV